jgi:hypothetical protein
MSTKKVSVPGGTRDDWKSDNWDKRVNSTLQCSTCHSYCNFRCRHNAPLGQAGWPAVYPTDWCMQHKISKQTMEEIMEGRS